MVEARGVVLATVLAALMLVGLLAVAVYRHTPAALKDQACENGQLSAAQCD